MQPSDRLPALPRRFCILSSGGLGLSRRSRRTPISASNLIVPSEGESGSPTSAPPWRGCWGGGGTARCSLSRPRKLVVYRFVILSAGGLGLSRRSRRTPITTQNSGVVIPSAAAVFWRRSRGTCGFFVALRRWFRASLQDRPAPECLGQQNPASPANHQLEGRHNRSPARECWVC